MRVSFEVEKCPATGDCVILSASKHSIHLSVNDCPAQRAVLDLIIARAAKNSRKQKAEAPPAQEAHEEIGGSD